MMMARNSLNRRKRNSVSKYPNFAWIKILSGLMIVIGFGKITWQNWDPDLGWHLKVGEWIWRHHAVPKVDFFTYTMPGHRWVDHEWLIELIIWWLRDHHLWLAVVAFFTLMAFWPFLVWLKRSKSLLDIWLVIISATLMINYIGIRPQIISFLLFFIVFDILYRQYILKIPTKYKVWKFIRLPIIFFLWVNLHAGFVAGLGLIVLFVFGNYIYLKINKQKIGKEVFYDLGIFITTLGVTFINPATWRIYLETFKTVFSPESQRYIAEWVSPLYNANLSLIILLAIWFFWIWRFWGKFNVLTLSINIIFLILFIKSTRMAPLFLITAMPVYFTGSKFALNELFGQTTKLIPHRIKSLLFIIGMAFSIFLFSQFIFSTYYYVPMLYPVKAAQFLNKQIDHNEQRRLFNEYGWGGYLIWVVPKNKVFIDGRMPFWVDANGTSAMKDYIKIYYQEKSDWKKVFQKYQIREAILAIKKPESKSLTDKFVSWVNTKLFDMTHLDIFKNQDINNKKTFSLENELIKRGWQIVYQDDAAKIIECSNNDCW